MEALMKFADYKTNYEGKPSGINSNGTAVDGKLYKNFQDKKLIQGDIVFAIRWTDKEAKLYFFNRTFTDIENKSVFSSEDYPFEFNTDKLEFTAGGSHWVLE